MIDSSRVAALPPEKIEFLNRRLKERAAPEQGIARTLTGPVLSPAQERLWFLHQLDGGGPAYNMPAAVRLAGDVNRAAVIAALEEVVRRHETLRTAIDTVDGRPVARVEERVSPQIRMVDLDHSSDPRAVANRLAAEESARCFGLESAPLLRCTLARVGRHEWVVLLTIHHIAADAWSMPVLTEEIARLYEAFSDGRPSSLPELAIRYRDYALWQKTRLDSGRLDRDRAYWKKHLTPVRRTGLPSTRPGPPLPSLSGAVETREIPGELRQALAQFAREERATLFGTLLAGFALLLSRYAGDDEISVGTPYANRGRRELEPLIGFLADTLPLRIDLAGNPTFREAVRRVKEVLLNAIEHGEIGFERIVDAVGHREAGQNPLFSILFLVQRTVREERSLPGVRMSLIPAHSGSAKFDLTLVMREHAAGITAVAEYSTGVFCDSDIRRLLADYERALDWLVCNPRVTASSMPLLTAADEHFITQVWNGTTQSFEAAPSLAWLAAEGVALNPDRIAAADGNVQLSYAELNRRAARLARELRAFGAGPECRVAVRLPRSVEMVTAVLAVMKSGAACVPIDPDYPSARADAILADSGAVVLIATGGSFPPEPAGCPLVLRPLRCTPIAAHMQRHSPIPSHNAQLAYVLYTSGSTGKPKGVAMPHSCLVNLIRWQTRTSCGTPAQRTLAFASLCFDVSFQEIFATLSEGGALLVSNDELRRDLRGLIGYLEKEQVERVFLPFAVLESLLQLANEDKCTLASLTTVITAGEQLHVTPAGREFFRSRPHCRLRNQYGPTETHVVTEYELPEASTEWAVAPPIGRPIANSRIYLLNGELRPVRPGIPGELCAGGTSLSRGYWDSPSLTAERFLPDPFSAKPGSRMYRTGDLARFQDNGEIDFLGRKDHQAKIRGFRVEPAEVETVLAGHVSVKQCAVVTQKLSAGQNALIAYVVVRSGYSPDIPGLREFLRSRLPGYMVPAAFQIMEALPMNTSGKIDRRSLPPYGDATSDPELAEQRPDEVESRLASIWQEVLGLKQVGVDDNFFEIGGDSILSIQVVARVSRAGYRLTPKELFENPTVRALRRLVRAADGASAREPETGQVIPLTPVQQWFFDQQYEEPHHWNMAYLLEVKAGSQTDLLRRAVEAVIERHQALRLRFEQDHGTWRQSVGESVEGDIWSVIDLSGVLEEASRRKLLEKCAARLQRSLDIHAGRLVRAAYFQMPAAEPGRLLLVVHHLVIDGVSWRILIEEIQRGYEQMAAGCQLDLGPKGSAFASWAARLQQYGGEAEVREDADYWRRTLEPGRADLPLDETPANQENHTRIGFVELDPDTTHALLKTMPQRHSVQIHEVLLTSLTNVAAEWIDAEELLVDVEGHGREELFSDLDLTRTVGWFTSIYPVRLTARRGEPAVVALKANKEQLRRIPRHGISYGLLRYLNPDTRTAFEGMLHPQISFNYLGQFDNVVGGAGLFRLAKEAAGPIYSPRAALTHLLYVSGAVLNGVLRISIRYSLTSFRPETVDILLQTLVRSLKLIVSECASTAECCLTPSDFPLARLEPRELEAVLREVRFHGVEAEENARNVEDCYDLTPVQQGLLFHSVDQDDGLYLARIHCTLKNVDPDLLDSSWQTLAERHTILRTAVAWKGAAQPVQVVGRRVVVPVVRKDFSTLAPDKRRGALGRFAGENAGLDLSQAPVTKVLIAKLDATTHWFEWQHHHLLLDGWSAFHLIRELFAIYDALSQGGKHELPPARPFRDYVAWLRRQDERRAEGFWKERLAGFREPTPLVFAAPPIPILEEIPGESRLEFDAATATMLAEIGRRQGFTPNTLIQGAWALLLAAESGHGEVLFGTTVSGRSADLEHFDTIAGLLINVLPMRVRIHSGMDLYEWLRSLQNVHAEMRQFQFCPLPLLRRWSDVTAGRPLFESLLTFENYPVHSAVQEGAKSVRASEFRFDAKNNYPLTAMVSVAHGLTIRVVYDRARFSPASVGGALDGLRALLRAIAEKPTGTVEQFAGVVLESRRRREMQTEEHRRQERAARLKAFKPVVVSVGHDKLVNIGHLDGREALPLVITPAVPDFDAVAWARANGEMVRESLFKYGALLFRGCGIDSISRFEQLAGQICGTLFGEYGDLPRQSAEGKIYDSTPYPADEAILFHNEGSHLQCWPMKICFHCVQPAVRGGETPIADCRTIYRKIDPDIRSEFEAKGLLYVRNFTGGFDVSWHDFFHTNDRVQVEQACRQAQMDFEWTMTGGLRVARRSPAVVRHPKTGEPLFFNQVQLHHAECLPDRIRDSIQSVFAGEDLPRNVYFGDGSPIPHGAIHHIVDIYKRNAVVFPWQRCDVLVLDNMLVAHARNPFSGSRKIVVAMGEVAGQSAHQ